MNYSLIQANLKALIERTGVTQAEIARKTETSARQVNRWVKGTNGEPTKIPKDKIQSLAKMFNMTFDELTTVDLLKERERVNGIMLRSYEYIDDMNALERYLIDIGVGVERVGYNFIDKDRVIIAYQNEKGKTICKTISALDFESLARRMKAHAFIEIKYIK